MNETYSTIEGILNREPDNYESKLTEISDFVSSLDNPLERQTRHSIKRMINDYISRIHEEKYQNLLDRGLQQGELDTQLDSYRTDLHRFIESSNDIFDKNKAMNDTAIDYIRDKLSYPTKEASYKAAFGMIEAKSNSFLQEEKEHLLDVVKSAREQLPNLEMSWVQRRSARSYLKKIQRKLSPKPKKEKTEGFFSRLFRIPSFAGA